MREGLGHLFNDVLMFFAGAQVEEAGQEMILRNGALYISLWSVFGAIGIPLGVWLLWKKGATRTGTICLVLGLLALLLVVPSLFHDEIRMTPQTIRVRTGVFWNDHWKEIPLEDLQELVLIRPTNPVRKETTWRFLYPHGAQILYHPPDLWRFNQEVILTRLRQWGVLITQR